MNVHRSNQSNRRSVQPNPTTARKFNQLDRFNPKPVPHRSRVPSSPKLVLHRNQLRSLDLSSRNTNLRRSHNPNLNRDRHRVRPRNPSRSRNIVLNLRPPRNRVRSSRNTGQPHSPNRDLSHSLSPDRLRSPNPDRSHNRNPTQPHSLSRGLARSQNQNRISARS